MDQGHEEQLALDVLRQVSRLLPGPDRRGADPPDFIVTDGERRISIEMTRYHQDSGPRGSEGAKRESLEQRVMAVAQDVFEASNPGVRVRVSPYFREGSLRRANVRAVAERVAILVAKAIPSDPSDSEPATTVRADWDMFDREELGEVLIHLSVSRWRNMSRGEWYATVGGYMSPDIASLERPLRAKEGDLPKYKATVDESWLVIYAPVGHASAFFDMELLSPQMFESTFDTVIFLDVHLGHFRVIGGRPEASPPSR